MSRYRRIEIIEPSQPSLLFIKQTSILPPTTFFPLCFPSQPDPLDFALDLLHYPTSKLLGFHDFDIITDLVQIDRTPRHTSTRRLVHHQVASESNYLQALCNRVSALELTFDKLVDAEKVKPSHSRGDRKYTWTAEVNDRHGLDRKYKWTAEIKGGEKKKEKEKEKEKKKDLIKGGGAERKYRWTAEIKDKGEVESPVKRRYVFEVSAGDGSECSETEKKEKEKDKKVKKKEERGNGVGRVVEIEETSDDNNHRAFVLRQVCFNPVNLVS